MINIGAYPQTKNSNWPLLAANHVKSLTFVGVFGVPYELGLME